METAQSTQVEKFKGRILKSKQKDYANKTVTTITRKFNFIDLTAAINHGRATRKMKTETISEKKFKITKAKLANYIEPTVFDTTNIKIGFGSIQSYLDECHPDIRTFIDKNEIRDIKAGAGELTIVLRNGIRMFIKTVASNQIYVKISTGKIVLFDGNTTVRTTKEIYQIKEKN